MSSRPLNIVCSISPIEGKDARKEVMAGLRERMLLRDARRWMRECSRTLYRSDAPARGGIFTGTPANVAFSFVDPEMPIDLLACFTHRLEPSITHELQQLASDRRLLRILILTRERMSYGATWTHNVTLPPSGSEAENGIVLPTEESQPTPALDVHELDAFKNFNMRLLVTEMLNRAGRE